MRPKIFFLLATSNTFNTKTFSLYKHKTYSNFILLNTNFYFKRHITTIYNAENVRKSFVYQQSSQKSSLSFDNINSSHESHHIHNISQVYPALDVTSTTQQQSKPTLMILIGWWNCKPKYLRKYISLYTDKFHIDTLSHIPPFYHVFFPWTISRDINRLAKELISTWIEHGKPNIGFHVFSNNGTYHYALLCEAVRDLSKNYLDNEQNKFSSSTGSNISNEDAESFLNSIKSCVIDSAPSPITEKYLALGIMGTYTGKSSLEPPPFLIPVLSIFFSSPFIKRYQDFVHKLLYNIPGGIHDGRNIRYLFLYGPGDQIVPEEVVLEFISRLKERESDLINNEKKGVLKIVEKRFGTDSKHVQHFLRYPDEYINILKSFYNI